MNWSEILHRGKARKEGPLECAICMAEIHRGNRRVVLLSCSHLYHQRCMLTLEKFVKDNEGTVGTCAGSFQHIMLTFVCACCGVTMRVGLRSRQLVPCADLIMKKDYYLGVYNILILI